MASTTINASQKVRASLVFRDAGGNLVPGVTASNPNWSSSNGALITVSADGQEADVVATGPIGEADVRMFSSTFPQASGHVTVTPGDPVTAEVVFGTPGPK